MSNLNIPFSSIVETVYNLPLEDRQELKNLLEHNIADARRNEIVESFKEAQTEHKANQLEFSSNMAELKKMLL